MMAIIPEIDACVAPLAEELNATRNGRLTRENRDAFCREHDESVACIEEAVQGCDPSEVEYAPSRINSLKLGLGQICESEEKFNSYLQYSECFSSHAAESQRCLTEFDRNAHELMLNDEDMCGAYQGLLDCVNTLFLRECSRGAAILYQDLARAYVPNQELCTEAQGIPTDSTDTGTRHIASTTLVFYVSGVLLGSRFLCT